MKTLTEQDTTYIEFVLTEVLKNGVTTQELLERSFQTIARLLQFTVTAAGLAPTANLMEQMCLRLIEQADVLKALNDGYNMRLDLTKGLAEL